jgi:hypothetical protein
MRTTLYWVIGFAYRSWMLTLKIPPTLVIEATHPLPSVNEMVPGAVVDGPIGSTRLPGLPCSCGGVHSGMGAVVVVVVDVLVVRVVVVVIVVVKVVVVGTVSNDTGAEPDPPEVPLLV